MFFNTFLWVVAVLIWNSFEASPVLSATNFILSGYNTHTHTPTHLSEVAQERENGSPSTDTGALKNKGGLKPGFVV